jgi:hypothetical protein
MSQENVELVRSLYRAGEPSRFFDVIDEEVELDFSAYPVTQLPRPAGQGCRDRLVSPLVGHLRRVRPGGHRDRRCRRGPR